MATVRRRGRPRSQVAAQECRRTHQTLRRYQMKRAMVIALPALFLVVVVSLGSVSLSSSATTTSPARDVVILICAANFGGSEPVIEVEASNSSSGTAPAHE